MMIADAFSSDSLTSLDDYTILRVIGQGSFGKVYQARLKGSLKIVALKFITKAQRTPAELDGLRSEAAILRSVRHPCIIALLDTFETQDDIIFVMEYALGDLRELGEAGAQLAEHDLARVAAQLFHALHYLHSCRIVHRDIKPQNVLLREDGRVALCDFGFARTVSASTAALCSMKGTPLYMAPELVHGRAYDYRSDVWSLGALLYELAVGRPPFVAQNIVQLAHKVARDPVQYPSTMSPGLRDLLGRLLVKDPAGRGDWRALARHPFVAGALAQMAPVLAREDPPWYDVRVAKAPGASASPAPHSPAPHSPRRAPEDVLSEAAAAAERRGTMPSSDVISLMDFTSRTPAVVAATARLADACCTPKPAAGRDADAPVPRALIARAASQLSAADFSHTLTRSAGAAVAAASAVRPASARDVVAALSPDIINNGKNRDLACLAAASAVLRAGPHAAAVARHHSQTLAAAAAAPSPAALVLLSAVLAADSTGAAAAAMPWTTVAPALGRALAAPGGPAVWTPPVCLACMPPMLRPALQSSASAALSTAAAFFVHAAATAAPEGARAVGTLVPVLAINAQKIAVTNPVAPALGMLAVAARAVLASEVGRLRREAPRPTSPGGHDDSAASDAICAVLAGYFVAGCEAACDGKPAAPATDLLAAAGQALWLTRAVRVARERQPPIAPFRSLVADVAPLLPRMAPALCAAAVTVICRIALSHYEPAITPVLPALLAPAAVRAYLSPQLPPEALADGLVLLAHMGRMSSNIGPLLAAVPPDALLGVLEVSNGTPVAGTGPASDMHARLRSKCANTVGNMLRHSAAALPNLDEGGVLRALVPLLSESAEVARWAAFALGNAAFHNGDSAVFEDAVEPLCVLLEHPEQSVRLNAAGGVSNVLRHARRLHTLFVSCSVAPRLERLLRDAPRTPDVATAAALALCSLMSSPVLRPTVTIAVDELRHLAAADPPAQLQRALGRLLERFDSR